MRGLDVQRAVREWDAEVDAEIVRLIEGGTPPVDAAAKARDIVSSRRAAANIGTDISVKLRDLVKATAAVGY